MEQHLSQYRIFFEVAKAGSISKAAKLLYISQPAISKSILRLEEGLEIALFVRTSKGVSLTPEGQIFYDLKIKLISVLLPNLPESTICHI